MIIRLMALTTLTYLVLPLVVVIGVSITENNFLAFPPQGSCRVGDDGGYACGAGRNRYDPVDAGFLVL
ncbi:hypothetical protein [Shinella sp.]|uniref:hypothetical protein n=1 Tax=Shinella sp. TaxID=1870904 RepID=UPI002899C1FA|nr:hypothetical protein [Shinella sp.]